VHGINPNRCHARSDAWQKDREDEIKTVMPFPRAKTLNLSDAQLSGCEKRCPGCIAVETWPLGSGVEMSVSEVVKATLDPGGAPRDGVTVLGGEPFLQPEGLLSLVTALKAHGQHVTLYSGYTLEELLSRQDPVISQILDLADILIDGPFVKELSGDAGEWRGSTNQRIIYK
jgi:anaerobic ribonucleoside-triphosphate reductase activating protein